MWMTFIQSQPPSNYHHELNPAVNHQCQGIAFDNKFSLIESTMTFFYDSVFTIFSKVSPLDEENDANDSLP